MCTEDPRIPGKEYPRTVEDPSLPSSSSSWAPFPPLRSRLSAPSHLFVFPPGAPRAPPCKYGPALPVPSGSTLAKGNRRLLQMLHPRGISPPPRPPFRSFFISPSSPPLPPASSSSSLLSGLTPPATPPLSHPVAVLCAARLSYGLRNQGLFEGPGVGGESTRPREKATGKTTAKAAFPARTAASSWLPSNRIEPLFTSFSPLRMYLLFAAMRIELQVSGHHRRLRALPRVLIDSSFEYEISRSYAEH